MYRIIGELESLGDSGESIARILRRRNSHDKSFTPEQVERLESMLAVIDRAYEVMINNLKKDEVTSLDIRMAVDLEIEINDLRNDIREAEILKMESDGSNYQASVYFLDTLSEIERMGDYIINISQTLTK